MPYGSDNVVKVWDHCTCDGVTPDADALQHCFDLAKQFERNVMFPARRSLYLEKSVFAAMGDSIVDGQNCLIINGTLDKPALVIGNSIDHIGGNTVQNLRFGQRSLLPGEAVQPGNAGLYVVKQSKFTGHRLYALKHPSSLYDGIKATDLANASKLFDVWADTAKNNGVTVTFSVGTTIRDCGGDACERSGLVIQDCRGIYGGGNGGYGNHLHAIEFGTAGLEQNGDLFWTDCGGDTSGSSNIMITHLRRAWIGIVWAASQRSRAVNTGAAGIEIRGPYAHHINFVSGAAYNNNGPGSAVVATEDGAPDLCSWGDNFDHGSTEFPNGVGNGQASPGIWFGGMTTRHIVGGTAAGNSGGAINKAFAPNVELRPNFP